VSPKAFCRNLVDVEADAVAVNRSRIYYGGRAKLIYRRSWNRQRDRPIPLTNAFETTSPRERAVLVRERARGAVPVEEREPHGLTSGLLDGARALEVVQVRRGEPRTRGIDLGCLSIRGRKRRPA